MFNVTIINAKKSIIKIVIITMFILIIFIINQMITKFKTNEILQINMSEKFVKCLSSEIPAMTSSKYKASNILKEDGEE